MRRLLPTLLLLAALTACGNSTEEQAFLDELNARDWPVTSKDLDDAQVICGVLTGKAGSKDRNVTKGLLIHRGYYYPVIEAAERHLCPVGG